MKRHSDWSIDGFLLNFGLNIFSPFASLYNQCPVKVRLLTGPIFLFRCMVINECLQITPYICTKRQPLLNGKCRLKVKSAGKPGWRENGVFSDIRIEKMRTSFHESWTSG